MVNRILEKVLKDRFFKGKAIILTGPRQVGKTTLSKKILTDFENKGLKVKKINCDNPTEREMLSEKDITYLTGLVNDAKIVFIDEGQKVNSIGQTLKLLVDHYGKDVQILVTGSSSFNLLDQTEEPLTGRKYVYTLYPFSFSELYSNDLLLANKKLEEHLIYGSYPDVVVNQDTFDDKREVLGELASSQLYKDILEFQEIKNSNVLRTLLEALALQLGSEVSYTELASTIGINKNTVEKYIDLLEKNFVIFRLHPYAKNKRRTIKKSKKIFFYDLGIRNTLINNFNSLHLRNDIGGLWENFLIIERIKKQMYERTFSNNYFWRSYDGQEIDWLEEVDDKLSGYEFKWNTRKKSKVPKLWSETYPDTKYEIITSENYSKFIM